MRIILGGRRKGKLIVKLVFVLFIAYIAALFVRQRAAISNKQQKIDELKEQISLQEMSMSELKSELNAMDYSDTEYMEDIAHKELKLTKPWERVFINIKGH